MTDSLNFPEPEPMIPRKGRPTLLDETKTKAVVDFLERGNTYTATAKAVGINPVTLASWLKRGKELSLLNRELTEQEQLFVDFSMAVEKARAMAEIRALEKIRQAGDSSWQAAAWYLERANPQEWGLIRRTEITGADGGAIQVDVEAVNRKLDALIANVVEAEVVEELPEGSDTALNGSVSGATIEPTELPEVTTPKGKRGK
jgi:transposase-like protein